MHRRSQTYKIAGKDKVPINMDDKKRFAKN